MHESVQVDKKHRKKLPEREKYCNANKIEAVRFDPMVKEHTSKSFTWSCHVAAFFEVFYVTCINAFIVYKLTCR